MAYHKFVYEDGTEYGSFEVFRSNGEDGKTDEEGEQLEKGFYWWPCQPGCLPDGPMSGPFGTYLSAVYDARSL